MRRGEAGVVKHGPRRGRANSSRQVHHCVLINAEAVGKHQMLVVMGLGVDGEVVVIG